MQLFGEQHRAIGEWLVADWWQKGPPVATIQGFPGIGKTEIALSRDSPDDSRTGVNTRVYPA